MTLARCLDLETKVEEAQEWETHVCQWEVEDFDAKALAGSPVNSRAVPIAGGVMGALVAIKPAPDQLLTPDIHGLAGFQLTFGGLPDRRFMSIYMVHHGAGHGFMPIAVGGTSFTLTSSLPGCSISLKLPHNASIDQLHHSLGFEEFVMIATIRDLARGLIQGDKIKIEATMRVAKLQHFSFLTLHTI